MAQEVTSIKPTLPSEDVIVRAVQFFSNSRWRVQTQSSRVATFVALYSWSSFVGGATLVVMGAMLSITLIGLIFGFPLMVLGFIILVIQKQRYRRAKDLIVTVNPLEKGSDVVITHSGAARKLVNQFVEALPK